MTLQFLDLKKAQKENTLIYYKTINWIKTLTPELDFENGKSFTKFVKRNLKLKYPYSVFVLYDLSLPEIVGIVSIVPDDQDVGKENSLDGIWIAGVNIRREFRNKGYGKILFKKVDNYLSKLEIKSFRVNLFVSNPHALRIYEKFGFKRIGLKVIKHNKENVVCSKFYNK